MNCPICNAEMEVKKKDVSVDKEKDKQYDRTLHICRIDDVWVTVEIPKERKIDS